MPRKGKQANADIPSKLSKDKPEDKGSVEETSELEALSPRKSRNRRNVGQQFDNKIMKNGAESNGEVIEGSNNDQKPVEKATRGRKKIVNQSVVPTAAESVPLETNVTTTKGEDLSNSEDNGPVEKSVPALRGRKRAGTQQPENGVENFEADLVNFKENKLMEKPTVKRGKRKADAIPETQKFSDTAKGTVETDLKTSNEVDLSDSVDNKPSDKALPAKRGRKKADVKSAEQKSQKQKQPETDNSTEEVEIPITKIGETSSLSTKQGRKKATETGHLASITEEDTLSENVETVTRSGRNTKRPEKTEDASAEDIVGTSQVGRKRKLKNKEDKGSESKRIDLSKKNSAQPNLEMGIDDNRHLRVLVKRCESLDEITDYELPQYIKSNDDIKVTTANESTKSGGRGKKGKEGADEGSKPVKVSKASSSKSKKEQIPNLSLLDFGNKSTTSDGKPWNLKIASWNINGIRAWLEKNALSYLHEEKPDILCLQETKCADEKMPDELNVTGYHCHWLAGDKDGYSGVGLMSKEKPLSVTDGIGMDEHDKEGRAITAEYENFYLVITYVPNAGRGLVRLDYRMQWDKDFSNYLKKLDEKKPVVLCGDLNVAHEEIDIANPKSNKKNAGFTKEEREGFSALLSEGFIDTFRHLYPDTKAAYTFWTYMMNARAKNVGWRLDYFVISKRLSDHLCDNVIRKDVFGSDHCPIALFLNI